MQTLQKKKKKNFQNARTRRMALVTWWLMLLTFWIYHFDILMYYTFEEFGLVIIAC